MKKEEKVCICKPWSLGEPTPICDNECTEECKQENL